MVVLSFYEEAVRTMGRVSTGVRGMRLDEDGDDAVVGMIVVDNANEETVMVVSEEGYGKRSVVEDYRLTNRGGKGVKTIEHNRKDRQVGCYKECNRQERPYDNKSKWYCYSSFCGRMPCYGTCNARSSSYKSCKEERCYCFCLQGYEC